jgi:L-alanine-DL-glutamate epimerase-like enolase superfamily enzyme
VTTITGVVARDTSYFTAEDLDGSDAMNQAPEYSAAYALLKTDTDHEGHDLTFTIGRGNELCVAAIEALAPLVVGRTLESFTEDMGALWYHVTGESQLRWVGPDKGVIHLATAAIVNAVWDLYARSEGKPLWKLLVDMSQVIAVSPMAKKFGVPVCPHAGGVGLCEYVQHLSIFDYICIGVTLEGRILEYVDHLHEHSLDPVHVEDGCYMPPTTPGNSIEMKPEPLDAYEFPVGSAWTERERSNV